MKQKNSGMFHWNVSIHYLSNILADKHDGWGWHLYHPWVQIPFSFLLLGTLLVFGWGFGLRLDKTFVFQECLIRRWCLALALLSTNQPSMRQDILRDGLFTQQQASQLNILNETLNNQKIRRNPLITIPGWWLLVTPVRACALAALPGLRSWCVSWVWPPWWRPRPLIGPNLRPRALIGCQLVTPSPCQCYVNAWRWWPMRARGLIGASLGHFMAGHKLGPCQLRMGDGTFLRCRLELFIKEPLSQYAKMPVSPLKPWQTRHSWFILRVFQFMPDCLTSSR